MNESPLCPECGAYWECSHARRRYLHTSQEIPITPHGMLPRSWDTRTRPMREATSVYIGLDGERPERDDDD